MTCLLHRETVQLQQQVGAADHSFGHLVASACWRAVMALQPCLAVLSVHAS